MTDVMAQIMGEQTTVVPNNDELEMVSQLATKQLELERRLEDLNSLVTTTTEELRQIKENLLPEAMAACNLKEFRLSNGFRITIKEDVYASIRADFVSKAVEWLDKNGLGGIVKHNVSVNFGRNEGEQVHKLMLFCEKAGMPVVDKESVHPQTLKATIKEQMARGVVFPEEFFSVHPVRKADIKFK